MMVAMLIMQVSLKENTNTAMLLELAIHPHRTLNKPCMVV